MTPIETNVIQEILTNQSADFISKSFPVDTYGVYGIQVTHSGGTYSFDSVIEITNTPSDPDSWIERIDTLSEANDQSTKTLGIDFETGFASARIKFFNVSGSIGSLVISKNKG